jgi:hypothetical protein
MSHFFYLKRLKCFVEHKAVQKFQPLIDTFIFHCSKATYKDAIEHFMVFCPSQAIHLEIRPSELLP